MPWYVLQDYRFGEITEIVIANYSMGFLDFRSDADEVFFYVRCDIAPLADW
jgi:hypothetical protein